MVCPSTGLNDPLAFQVDNTSFFLGPGKPLVDSGLLRTSTEFMGMAISPRSGMPKHRVLFFQGDAAC